MPQPVSYEQIRRELAVKRKLKPWEVAMSQDQPEPLTAEEAAPLAAQDATDPLVLAAKREQIQKMLAPMGEVVNPETEALKAKKPRKQASQGLIQMLLGLMR